MVKSTKLAFLAATAFGPLLSTSTAVAQTEPERTAYYSGTLTQLNESGVSGSFTIEQRGQGQIRVNIQATGLEASAPINMGHIHGLAGSQDASCPTLAQDDDGDGFVELLEGLETYGPVIIDFGDVDPNDDGVVNYSMTFNLNKSAGFASGMDKGDLLPLDLRHIVLHGLTLEAGEGSNGGEADGTAGYKQLLPVACGEITQVERRDALQFRTR